MPTIRKVPAEEAAQWETFAGSSHPRDDRYEWLGRPAVLFLQGKPRSLACTPHIGDVLRLHVPEHTPPSG